jgi:hypothetical protein
MESRGAAFGLRDVTSGRAFSARLLFVFVNRNLLQVLGFKDLIALQASQVIDPVAPHQKFGALVLTTHKDTRLSLF